jgi:hypothetical protein
VIGPRPVTFPSRNPLFHAASGLSAHRVILAHRERITAFIVRLVNVPGFSAILRGRRLPRLSRQSAFLTVYQNPSFFISLTIDLIEILFLERLLLYNNQLFIHHSINDRTG